MAEATATDPVVTGISLVYTAGEITSLNATKTYAVTVDDVSVTASRSSDVWDDMNTGQRTAFEVLLGAILEMI